MSVVEEILLSDGTSMYVEAERIDLPDVSSKRLNMDLPPGAEEVSAIGKVTNAMEILRNTIKATANTVNKGILETNPDEWSVELGIGFKGKTNPIPVILSGESNVAIKVVAKWKKPEEVK